MTENKKASLFELDAAELDLLGKLESLFTPPMDQDIDPGAEAERLVDEHLASLADVQEKIGEKLVGYVHTIRAKRARAALFAEEARLYKVEAERLANKALEQEDTADFLELRLKAFLERRELTALEVGSYELKIVKAGGKQALQLNPQIAPVQVGEAFTKLTEPVPAMLVFDKEKIEAALKQLGELTIELPTEDGQEAQTIAWASLKPRETKLKIK